MRLVICARTRVPDFGEAEVTHFVSLIDPDEKDTLLQIPKKTLYRLQLVFHDLDDLEMTLPCYARYVAPTEAHVASLVEFGKKMASLDDWGLLTHCESGISRSTAAAITLLVSAGYSPQVAFGLARKACPQMLPNRRILRIADGMLETGGKLQKMAEIYRRKAFQRAGYEDPTNVLLAKAAVEKSRPGSLLARLLRFLSRGGRPRVGTSGRARGAGISGKHEISCPPPISRPGDQST
ncbi:MAG: hypothetical protein WCS65_15070 [Verrucomicrobiae bacterium]